MSPLEQLAELAALWSSDVRVSVRRSRWHVRVVDGGGRDVARSDATALTAAIADALRELQALDAQETA